MVTLNSMFLSIIVLMFLLFIAISLSAAEYQVDKNQNNEVKIISDAPIEDFEGVTDKIDGYLYYEENDLTKNSEMYFEIDLNSLDTGIGLRNRPMREDYLETDKFPFTYFKGKIVEADESNGSQYSVKVAGKIFIHGVERDLNSEGSMKRMEDSYHIKTNFIVKLSDFNIEIPSLMFLKINENMDVRLDFYVKKVEKN